MISRFNNQVARDAQGFSRQLMSLMQYVRGDWNQVVRKTCLDLFGDIQETTPVDTGRAKANWSIDTDVDSSLHEANRQYSPHQSFNPSGGSTIYIFNNLEYIEALEDGHSEQAPNGFVALSLQKFERHLAVEAEKLGFRAR